MDGLDGKPHAGPFVDTTPEELRAEKGSNDATPTTNAVPTFMDKFTGVDEKYKLEDIPYRNDGVMNDENRIGPKKGTDGTEGGISEKEKERKAKGFAENKPQGPKEAPPLPHSEQEAMEEENEKLRQAGAARDSEKATSSYTGLERPDDLPDTPYSVDAPAPKPPADASKFFFYFMVYTLIYTEGPPRVDRDPSQPIIIPPLPVRAAEQEGWHEWVHSFVLSLTMILFSEIGDKTFLVAALMAMRHSPVLVFSAAFAALAVMTVLSAILGHVLPSLLPKRLTTFAAAILFIVFGLKMLREGLQMDPSAGVGEEMKEVEAELEEKEQTMSRTRRRSSLSPYTLESGRGRQSSKFPSHPNEPSPPSSRSPSPPSPSSWSGKFSGILNLASLLLSPAWVQTFVMTFLGEWGDRSQIATIAMAAGQDYVWVTLGAVLGHAFCTGIAVIGGRALAGRVSLRVGKSASHQILIHFHVYADASSQ